jgi:cytochrome c oxidase subunit 2
MTLGILQTIFAVVDRENFLLPKRASVLAGDIDWITYFILWVCLIFGGLVFLATAYIAVRYRHKKGVNDVGSGPTHSTLLEITWSVIPGIIVLLMAIWGFKGYMNYTVAPANAMEIQVEGYKWAWEFTYPNGFTTNELHIPKDVPVRFVMTSRDVIHSLYLPQLRIKKDVVPGRYNKMWATADVASPLKSGLDPDDPNSYDPTKGGDPDAGWEVFCTEYCGTKHSKMLARLYVHPNKASYEKWLSAASDPFRPDKDGNPPKTTEVGYAIANRSGCYQCHSVDGTKNTGPTWKDLFGSRRTFNDGKTRLADEDYLRESIIAPQKEIVQGYGGAMPSYAGKLSDRSLTAIINYQKSISQNFKGDAGELDKPLPKEEKKEAPK